jgi:transposase, IS30 family
MHTYHHFSPPEREEISRGLAQGLSLRAIAASLNRSSSSVSREVRRNAGLSGYRAYSAGRRAWRRTRIPRQKPFTVLRPTLWQLVQDKIRLQWSPQQISSWLKETYDDAAMHASHETIYAALYVLPRGTLRKELLSHLRQRHRQRRKRGKLLHDRRGQIPELVSIHDRPVDVEGREFVGHWEGDMLLGKSGTGAIVTLVERKTRYLMLAKLSQCSAIEAWKKMAQRFSVLPEDLRLSLTYDRGQEMRNHAKLTKAAKVKVYFCDPQSPWQRGTNENTNGLLRQYFPKGTDMRKITAKDLRFVEERLNGRPRKVLRWLTPHEVFISHLSVALGG